MTTPYLLWAYRRLPGPTAAHLWWTASTEDGQPRIADTNPLCGLTTHGSGEWAPDTGRTGRCGLCERRRERYHPNVETVPS